MKDKAVKRYHFTDGGIDNVWLENGFTEHSTNYGKAVSFADVHGLTKAICIAFTRKPSALSGAEFRYLRLGMLMSQTSLGELLGVSSQAIALWEKEKQKVPKAADIALRVIYTAHVQGDEQVKNIVTALNEAERVILIMRETSKGWKVRQEAAISA